VRTRNATLDSRKNDLLAVVPTDSILPIWEACFRMMVSRMLNVEMSRSRSGGREDRKELLEVP